MENAKHIPNLKIIQGTDEPKYEDIANAFKATDTWAGIIQPSGATVWNSKNFPIVSGNFLPTLPTDWTATWNTRSYSREGTSLGFILYGTFTTSATLGSGHVIIKNMPFRAQEYSHCGMTYGQILQHAQSARWDSTELRFITASGGYLLENQLSPNTAYGVLISDLIRIAPNQ